MWPGHHSPSKLMEPMTVHIEQQFSDKHRSSLDFLASMKTFSRIKLTLPHLWIVALKSSRVGWSQPVAVPISGLDVCWFDREWHESHLAFNYIICRKILKSFFEISPLAIAETKNCPWKSFQGSRIKRNPEQLAVAIRWSSRTRLPTGQ